MNKQTHYPSYQVMSEQDQWDGHTQKIVGARLYREHSYKFLNTVEAETLRAWCSLLMDDGRDEIIQYVLKHIDDSLTQDKGEGQRKMGTPKVQILIRAGLKAINEASAMMDSRTFFHLEEVFKKQLMRSISDNTLAPTELWEGISPNELFQKLLSLTVEAYYSHPQIWSEIGYGGPAYPRGYVRADIGHLDPWEAVREP
jgi:hypothetical protein